MNKRTLVLSLLGPASLAVVAAGCGGSSSAAASSSHTPSTTGPVVAVAHNPLGSILVDTRGRSLYLFEQDKGTTSTCTGACASVWPPVKAPAGLVAGRGVAHAKLGVTRRKDGRVQVTYAGHPLYSYAGDAKPGDTRGQGIDQFGAKWYVLAPNGRKIDED